MTTIEILFEVNNLSQKVAHRCLFLQAYNFSALLCVLKADFKKISMMKNIFWIILPVIGLMTTHTAQAQTIGGIEYKTIQEQVSDSESVYYYPRILKRFQVNDLSLKNIDYVMLYYGFVLQSSYNPYTYMAWEDSLSNLTEKQKGKEALALAEKLLAENPVSLFGNIEKAYTYKGLNQDDKALIFLDKYKALMQAMMFSGVGSSYENPITVITPKDAEAVLKAYKLVSLSKTLNGNAGRYYDVYLVRNEQGKQYPIYFDITLPYTIGMAKLKK